MPDIIDPTFPIVMEAALQEYAARRTYVQPHWKAICFSTELVQNGQRRHVGGYADRLKGLLSTALMAILADRTFLIEWAKPHSLSQMFEAGQYDWVRSASDSNNPLTQWSEIDAIDHHAFNKFRGKVLNASELFDDLASHEHSIKLHCNIDFIEDLIRNKVFLMRSRLGRVLLKSNKPAPELASLCFGVLFRFLFKYRPSGNSKEYWKEFLRVRANSNMVGIQFRTGQGAWTDPRLDNVENAQSIAWRALAECQARRISSPTFFISSDNLAAGEAIEAALQVAAKVLRFGLPPAHFERSDLADLDVRVRYPLMEHMCLAHCDLVVHGNGGFGATAAKLGGVPGVNFHEKSGAA